MKKILFISTIIASIFIINNLVRSIYTLWNKQDLLVKAEKNLEVKKKENEELKKQLVVVKSPDFVEKEARNKLFMVKPGESQIVIPEDLLKASESAKQRVQDLRPNWKKWWDLFF